jgi:hypothetical protein
VRKPHLQTSVHQECTKNAPVPQHCSILQEHVEAAKIELTAADLKEIDSALSEFKIHGGRMNAEQMQVVEA